MPKYNKFGAALVAEMAVAGIEVIDLAAAVRLNTDAVYRRLRGATDWRLRELEALAGLLGLSVSKLLKKIGK